MIPTRHPFTLTREKTALLVIDMQDKFAPAIPEFDRLTANTVRCILTCQMFSMPVFVSEQYPQGLGNTVSVIRQQFSLLDVIEKTEFSCAGVPQFQRLLNEHKPDTVIITGVETHVCVNQTVLDLIALGIKVHVVADACGSRHTLDHQIALAKMEKAGALIDTTEMVLFELAQKAGTESFKNIQRMVKAKFSPAPVVTHNEIPDKKGEDPLVSAVESAAETSEAAPLGMGEKIVDQEIAHVQETAEALEVQNADPVESASVNPDNAIDTESNSEVADLGIDLDALLGDVTSDGAPVKELTVEEENDALDLSGLDKLLETDSK